MRVPLIGMPSRQQLAITKPIPPPVGGINARESIASMPIQDAYSLQNIFPSSTYMEFRGGCAAHITTDMGGGAGLDINTLAVYSKLDGTEELWAFGDGVFNVSSPGAGPAATLARNSSSVRSDQWTMFGDGTKQWLIAVNGTGNPAYYDGTTWTDVTHLTSPALTGYPSNAVQDFINVHVFKGRLFFIPKNSLSFWYLPAGVAGGALTEFSLAGEAALGGYLMAMETWTRDGGSGPDDFAVFFTSQGEAIIYQGTNPSSATTWAKVGSFRTGRPLGRKCASKYGSDILLLTEDGVFTLSSVISASEEDRAKYALSYKIQPLFAQYAKDAFSFRGWRAVFYPAKEALIVNVPINGSSTVQLVMNTTTKAWTRFTNWHTLYDFAIYNRELYAARLRRVYKCWSGTEDVTAGVAVDIAYSATQSYQGYGVPNLKHVKSAMPLLEVNEDIVLSMSVNGDFNIQTGGFIGNDFAQVETVNRQWGSIASWPGRWVSITLGVTSDTLTGKWHGSILMFEPGGP